MVHEVVPSINLNLGFIVLWNGECTPELEKLVWNVEQVWVIYFQQTSYISFENAVGYNVPLYWHCREMEATNQIELATLHRPLPIHCSRGATDKPATECRHTSLTNDVEQLCCSQTVKLNPNKTVFWTTIKGKRKEYLCSMIYNYRERFADVL